MHKTGYFLKLSVFTAVAVIIAGCADQPTGYIFTPTQRDKTFLTGYAAAFISRVYTDMDNQSGYLSSASLTNDYLSVLPEGWQRVVIGGDTAYMRNYMDETFQTVRFDPQPQAGAIRVPSSLSYQSVDIASYRNPLTNSFYGDTSSATQLLIDYSGNRQDPDIVDGWMEIQVPIQVEYQIQLDAGGGQKSNYTSYDYVMSTWQMKIERYSVDSRDQRAHISFNGTYPLIDRAGQLQQPQVSGTFDIQRDGTGTGDVWLYGDKVSKVTFTGRSFGFDGYFTLYEENNANRYTL